MKLTHEFNPFLKFGSIALGCMGLSGFYGPGLQDQMAFDAFIHEAFLKQIRSFDTARVYNQTKSKGIAGAHNEKMLGEAFAKSGQARSSYCIATKCGFTDDLLNVDASPEHIRTACQDSLMNLKTDYIDLYYLHRMPATLAEFNRALETFSGLFHEGKIRYIGLSEASQEFIRYAHAFFEAKMAAEPDIFTYNPFAAVENEFSIFTPQPLKNGLIDTCAELNITFVPYSPLSRGLLTEGMQVDTRFDSENGDLRRTTWPRFQEPNFSKNLEMRDKLILIALGLGCSVEQLALAWLLKQIQNRGCASFLIPGTTNLARLEQNVGAFAIVDRLTPTILARIHDICPHGAYGLRYPEEFIEAHHIVL